MKENFFDNILRILSFSKGGLKNKFDDSFSFDWQYVHSLVVGSDSEYLLSASRVLIYFPCDQTRAIDIPLISRDSVNKFFDHN
jgi:hypothetical protein